MKSLSAIYLSLSLLLKDGLGGKKKDLLFVVGCVWWGKGGGRVAGSNESNKGDNEWAGAEVINDSGGSD
jgi:hypothetical protein